MAQIDIDKFVISLRRCFGEDKGIATSLDRCLFSLGLKYVDTPTGGRLERVDQPTMLEKIMWESGEQKPWSEEDQSNFNELSSFILETYRAEDASRLITWLNSLKDRVGCEANCTTTKEWSEEDKKRIEQICDDLKSGMINFYANEVVKGLHYKEIIESNIEWLKSLKPQSTWKPSKESIMALRWVLNNIPYDSHKEEINGLLEQLLKLL